MKAPRASCEGYITMRTSPSSPPPMQKRYCVLVGTCFYYYSSQEDAEYMLRLKGQVDVIGVQEWDGKGNMHIYANGFLFATAQNKVFYAYTDTPMDKEKWIRAIQMTVETTMPRSSITKQTIDPMPPLSSSSSIEMLSPSNSALSVLNDTQMGDAPVPKCMRCTPEEILLAGTTRFQCQNCDHFFCDRHCANKIPLPHRNFYYTKRVCEACYYAQVFVNYLKAITERLSSGICLYPRPLNINSPIELIMPNRPSHTAASTIALDLFKQNAITAEELEELLSADKRYLDHTTEQPEIPLDIKILSIHREFKHSNFSVFRTIILLHQHLESDILVFKPIVEKIYAFSYTELNQVEFYWPQIVHAYLKIPTFEFEKLFWMDELILSICSRSIHLALLLIWQLRGALEDAIDVNANKDMQSKYPRVVKLIVEIELLIVGVKREDVFKPRIGKNETKLQILPTPTHDQLKSIEKYMQLISNHREQTNATYSKITSSCVAQSKPEDNHNSMTVSVVSTSIASISAETHAHGTVISISQEQVDCAHIAPIGNAANSSSDVSPDVSETKFSDYSRFQQHLLTPKEDILNVDVSAVSADNGTKQTLDVVENGSSTSSYSQSESYKSIQIVGNRPRAVSEAELSVLASYYNDECDFVEQITDIAEKLRFVAIIERKVLLPKHLANFQLPPMAYIPLVKASDSFERIINLPANEGTAFSTKARVPIMLIFEVIRGTKQSSLHLSQLKSPSAVNSASKAGSFENDNEEEEIKRLISGQSPNGFTGGALVEDEIDLEMNINLNLDVLNQQQQGNNNVPITPTEGLLPLETPMVQNDTNPMSEDTEDCLANNLASDKNSSKNAFDLPMDLSNVTLSKEVLERENDRKKDLEAAFGESWHSKRERMKNSSKYGHLPGWDIVSMIGKSNDDLRQEVFTLQLIQKFMEIFKSAKLPMWLKVYRIIATSSSTGLIETLANAISLDGLKKREGYVSLLLHFEKSYGDNDSVHFIQAQKKFIQSMAGYSLVCYFLQIKDRHNGNIMLDNEGHIIHIDYGFLLGIAPGGSFSIETAPFKLTTEMVDTMGGQESEGYKEYVTLCTRGFLALQSHCDELVDLVEIMATQSPYPCFYNKDIAYILSRFRSRFKQSYGKHEVVQHVLNLIRKSNGNYSTRQYDSFQRLTNGILP